MESTTTSVAGFPPTVTLASSANPVPVITIFPPPAVEPSAGLTDAPGSGGRVGYILLPFNNSSTSPNAFATATLTLSLGFLALALLASSAV